MRRLKGNGPLTHTEKRTHTPSPALPSGQGVPRPPAAPGSVESVHRSSFSRQAPAACTFLRTRQEALQTRPFLWTDGQGSRCQRRKSIPRSTPAGMALPRGSVLSGGGRFLEKFPAHISRLTHALFPLEFKHGEARGENWDSCVLSRPQTEAKLKLDDKKNLRLFFLTQRFHPGVYISNKRLKPKSTKEGETIFRFCSTQIQMTTGTQEQC